MATEKRLIERIAERLKDAYPQADRNNLCPAIYYDDFAEIVDDVLSEIGESVDAVEVSRLGKLGKMMMPYLGCPRGMIGHRGEDGGGKDRSFEILELDPITDIDGNRWVPVLDRDLAALKDKTQDAVEVVRCKDCKHCERDHTLDAGGDEYYYCWHIVMEHGQARPNEFCCYGERKDNDGF